MKKISAEIIADSVDQQGNRITSFILTYPRFIHAELMTHRMFSRNSASSRAIPFEKMLKMVEEDPFIPIAWQEDHKGMQGTKYLKDLGGYLKGSWIMAAESAINSAKLLNSIDLTKQLCNRVLEPFMWHTVLVTATEYDNFFDLRCPKYKTRIGVFKSKKDAINDNNLEPANEAILPEYSNTLGWLMINQSQAEIHMQALAEAMWDAYNESTPKKLESGQWHIPFGDQIEYNKVMMLEGTFPAPGNYELWAAKIAVARCARLSYMTFDGEIDYEKDIKLHDQLLKAKHSSPFEHVCRTMTDLEYYSFIKGKYPTIKDEYGILNYERLPYSVGEDEIIGFSGINPRNPDIYGWCYNMRGFIPYRYLIENVERTRV